MHNFAHFLRAFGPVGHHLNSTVTGRHVLTHIIIPAVSFFSKNPLSEILVGKQELPKEVFHGCL